MLGIVATEHRGHGRHPGRHAEPVDDRVDVGDRVVVKGATDAGGAVLAALVVELGGGHRGPDHDGDRRHRAH